MIKKILVLEDSAERITWFQNNFNMIDFYFCKTVRVAKGLLKLQTFDLMFLDHDLGETKLTGYDFAKLLAEEIREGRVTNNPIIYIHTSNPVGAKNMQNVLPQAIVCPFYELITKKVKK